MQKIPEDDQPNHFAFNNDEWGFLKGKAPRSWIRGKASPHEQSVRLPHCINLTDTFKYATKYYRGPFSYRKKIDVGPKDSSIWILKAGGFYGTGTLWINGRKITDIDGQYLGFSLDITPSLIFDAQNILVIELTNSCSRNVLPGIREPDFLLYGGLSGGIMLNKLPPLYLHDFVHIRTTSNSGSRETVTIDYALVNADGSFHQVSCEITILDPSAKMLSKNTTLLNVPAHTKHFSTTSDSVDIGIPEKWCVQHPRLYTAIIRISGADGRTHSKTVRFGIRTIEFRPRQGMFLNDERVFLKGVNRHESMPGAGNALGLSLNRADAELIKEMGLNFVRLSHYPQSPDFLDACDELGILVYAELSSWKSVRTGQWLINARRQLTDLIRRDINRPSVIFWGLGNESRSKKAFTQLAQDAKELDPTRFTIYAENHFYRARRHKTLGIVDVWGCNYELEALEQGIAASRTLNAIVSECSNAPETQRGCYAKEISQLHVVADDIDRILSENLACGFTIWCLCDYATMRKKRFLRFSGLYDAWRQPKLAAFYLKARFSNQPVLEWALSEDKTEITIVSNMKETILSACDSHTELARYSDSVIKTLRLNEDSEILLLKGTNNGDFLQSLIRRHNTPPARIDCHQPAASQDGDDALLHVIDISVMDLSGNLCRTNESTAFVSVEPPAKPISYTDPPSVKISGGTGRLFVRTPSQSEPIMCALSIKGIDTCRIELRPS